MLVYIRFTLLCFLACVCTAEEVLVMAAMAAEEPVFSVTYYIYMERRLVLEV